MFFKKDKENKATTKIDKIITGIIIGGAVAGAVGLSRTEKAKQIKEKIKTDGPSFLNKTHDVLGGTLIKVLSLFDNKK